MGKDLHYPGQELELFREARNWKRYFSSRLRPYIRGRVLEVGAGLGENQPYLTNEQVTSWTSLEPDPSLFEALQARMTQVNNVQVHAIQGTTAMLGKNTGFDTILYIDVLEHIEADNEELRRASDLLLPGGRLIVLSPAYPALFSPFDKAIGHYRRYTRAVLRQAAQGLDLQEEKLFHLESAGCALLLVNKALARKSYPTRKTVRFWDHFVVPVSKGLDRLFGYRFGKSIIGIWRKSS